MEPRRRAEVASIVWADRHQPISEVVAQARALEASGAVDSILCSDQMTNLIPRQLWTAENTAMAAALPDPDSHPDAFVISTVTAMAAPSLRSIIATDSVRRGPMELMQTMLTMANVTQGKSTFHVGAGEAKQCRPFGWKRSHGVGRLEDLFEIFHKVLGADAPIDHKGNFTTLQQAYIGSGKPYRPEIWGLGGGPRLLDLAFTHADGVSATAPCQWTTPEEAHDQIEDYKRILEQKGRDPEAFGFGIYCPILMHDDEELVEQLLDNSIVRWLAGVVGRIHAADWAKDGIESPIPAGWGYFQNLYPYEMEDAFIREVVEKSTRDVVERGWFYGTPQQVGATLRAYIDAGITFVLPCDWSPLVLDAADVSENQLRRNIELCEAIKATTPAEQ